MKNATQAKPKVGFGERWFPASLVIFFSDLGLPFDSLFKPDTGLLLHSQTTQKIAAKMLSIFFKVCKTSFRPLFHSISFAKPCHISLEVQLETFYPRGRQQGLRECKKKLKSFSRPLGPHTTAHSDSQPQLGSASRHARRVLSLTHQRLGGSGHQLDAAAAMISKFLALAWGNTES